MHKIMTSFVVVSTLLCSSVLLPVKAANVTKNKTEQIEKKEIKPEHMTKQGTSQVKMTPEKKEKKEEKCKSETHKKSEKHK